MKDARYKGACGGRGSGKSHFFAGALVEECIAKPGTRAVGIREVQKALKQSAMRLVIDKIEAYQARGFSIRSDHIITPGNGLILFQGMQDHTAESIKSLEGFRIAWIEEAQTLSERSNELLRPSIRMAGSSLWYSWNPRNPDDPVDKFFNGPVKPPDSVCIKVNYDSNPWFTKELELERSHDEKANPDRYAHIWLGDYEPVAIGAIWDRLILHKYRRPETETPDLARIVIAVDPAVSSERGSDEHGIVVVGLGHDKRGYVLDDGSMRGTPQQWANRAISMHDKWGADAIVIERNQGGDMCRETLRTYRPSIRVIEVTATRGKHVRAEPISALYHLGSISHVGTFPELENQMCKMTAAGYEGEGSPDRCDAMVWGFTELFEGMLAPVRKKKHEPHYVDYSGGWM